LTTVNVVVLAGRVAADPAVRRMPLVEDGAGFVMDRSAACTMYASPTGSRSSSRTTVRRTAGPLATETAGVQVDRVDAICRLSGS
jgi:single-stranded DNA-binding protein